MKTYITIYLTNGVYGFRSKHDLDPTIWIEPGNPNILIREEKRMKCHRLQGMAWKFTLDPFRDTIEVYCGVSEETHPLRVVMEKMNDMKEREVILDYHISRQDYLSGGKIMIRQGETPEEELYDIKSTTKLG